MRTPQHPAGSIIRQEMRRARRTAGARRCQPDVMPSGVDCYNLFANKGMFMTPRMAAITSRRQAQPAAGVQQVGGSRFMASLLEKVQTLIQANLHSLVDNALKANSMAVIDQYIRDVDNNLDALEDAAATVGGQVKTLQRKRDEYAKQTAELDKNIDMFLTQNKEDLARAAQAKLNSVRNLSETYQAQLERQEKEYKSLLDARLKLQAKLTTIRQQREEMAALMELAKAKEITNRTIKSLDDLAGVGDVDVARMADAIRTRLDKASAQAEVAATSLDQQMDEALGRGELDAQLEERKRRLGIGQQ
jgi:phage shock protein A